MSDLRYHSLQPQNQKQSYQEMDQIDFNISFAGRKLVSNTVRLTGNVSIFYPPAANPPEITSELKNDPFTGCHCFIDRIDTSFSTSGTVENLSDYPRYISTKAHASLQVDDLNNSVYVCEGRSGSEGVAVSLLKGMVDYTKANLPNPVIDFNTQPLDFSLKLDNCLNNVVSSDGNIPAVKTGDIRVSLTLARNVTVLFANANIGNTIFYELKNLKLMFCSVADNGVYAPSYQMRVKTSLKNSLQSSYANISTKVPMVCDSMFCSVIQQANENNVGYNGLQLERPPNVESLQFIWSDSLSQEFRYELRSEEEILYNFIKAVSKQVTANSCNPNALASNKGWGLGLDFGQFVDLSQSKIGINLKSDISSANPYTLYMYFSGLFNL
jgi:hypothetical protein